MTGHNYSSVGDGYIGSVGHKWDIWDDNPWQCQLWNTTRCSLCQLGPALQWQVLNHSRLFKPMRTKNVSHTYSAMSTQNCKRTIIISHFYIYLNRYNHITSKNLTCPWPDSIVYDICRLPDTTKPKMQLNVKHVSRLATCWMELSEESERGNTSGQSVCHICPSSAYFFGNIKRQDHRTAHGHFKFYELKSFIRLREWADHFFFTI